MLMAFVSWLAGGLEGPKVDVVEVQVMEIGHLLTVTAGAVGSSRGEGI